ncbi:Lysosomal beta glucosidase [Smittium mucronatum]|uniref:beta-glucosidase n=1 Tax=Smittium mucronatum TaxID=133383 RepID=A0A1R0GVU7_9FUNG|nr:Lysosomal beta glucosidase [Smittium mucronatum]
MRYSSLFFYLAATVDFKLCAAQGSLIKNTVALQPQIDVVGVSTLEGVVCLPDFFPLQDLDPMKPKSVDNYTIPQFDESGYIGPTSSIDSDVLELLASLSIEDKVGQMVQVPMWDMVGCDGLINMTYVNLMVEKYRVGSVLDSPSNNAGRWNLNSPQRFANFTNTFQQVAVTKGSKIPIVNGIDTLRGAGFVKGATTFTAPVNTGATFNPIHAYNAGRVGAKDTRSVGVHWTFGPLADINVQKLWSRNYENFGEDPYLIGEMMHAGVKGVQGNYKKDRTRIAATFKHFIGYSDPRNGLDQGDRYIPFNHLLEFMVPQFQRAIDAGSATGMEAYGALNGQDTIVSKRLLKTLLRDQMNFTGVLISDFNEIYSQFDKHFTAFNMSDATFMTLNNTSVDMSMGFEPFLFVDTVLDLVNSGLIPESRIDESVSRILQLKKDLGLFENPYSDLSLIDTVGSAQDVELARDGARESLILLKNENNVLPLSPEENVLFVGPSFNSSSYITGAWSIRMQGANEYEKDTPYGGYCDTILEGVEGIIGRTPNYIQGYTIEGDRVSGYDTIVRQARKADKVVFLFGERPGTEVAANIRSLKMAEDQYNIARRVIRETSTPVVLLLLQNHPYLLGELSSLSDGIINANLPGAYGGLPVAEALYGKFSPSGRQPYSYPKMDYQAPVTYFSPLWNEYDPEFAFGQGFGYNNITYSNITVSSAELRPGNPITVSVTAFNNGKMSQLEPVLMFTTQKIRREYAPERYRLRAFDKQPIAPGTSRVFSFNLAAEEMMFYNIDNERILSEGPVDITINAFNKNAVVESVYLHVN